MAFKATRRLDFADCDLSGIAFFPMYFRHLVGVVEEFFAELGAPWPALMREQKIGTPTAHLNANFASPAVHGETLTFSVLVEHVGRASLKLRHEVSCGERALWQARHTLVATSLETHRSIPWPDALRQALLERNRRDMP
jgi:4-hydroxybenzoyl-CoA thioesterase